MSLEEKLTEGQKVRILNEVERERKEVLLRIFQQELSSLKALI